MADPDNKVDLNVDGEFFVDRDCIDCDLCRTTAPANFRRSEEEGYSYVYTQPATDDERELCRQAVVECPVEAIGEAGTESAG